MPELPEVETIRRQLEPELAGRRIAELEVLDPKWSAPIPGERLATAVGGRRIERLSRRGKYLLFELEGGDALVMHLRMTGNLVLEGAGTGAARHLRARIRLDDGRRLAFTDARRFGTGLLLGGDEVEPYFASRLGVEPLSERFTAGALETACSGRKAPLKSFLLDQSRLAGVGNIYADEALFRARLHPLSPAGSMRPEHHRALRDGIVAALEAGIGFGGASIDDYRDSRGDAGQMQDEFLVHRREGEPCPGCGEPIQRIVVSGRSTYYCPRCQVRLRRRRS